MRVRGIAVFLAVAASLGIGLMQAMPGYAASAAPATHAASSVSSSLTPDLIEKNVHPKTTNGCSAFKGTIEYDVYLVGHNYESRFSAGGTLHQTCAGGGTRLYGHWTCDSETPQGPRWAERARVGSERVDKSSPECSYGMVNMYVEVCWHNNRETVHQCANSAKINA